MGNFSLTLIDSLDMLVVLGDITEFESAVKKVSITRKVRRLITFLQVIQTVRFDTDVVVSVFETNIRVVG